MPFSVSRHKKHFTIRRVVLHHPVLGLNEAIKFLFKSIRDEHRMKKLEKHTLQTELKYLKHQVNPHFLGKG